MRRYLSIYLPTNQPGHAGEHVSGVVGGLGGGELHRTAGRVHGHHGGSRGCHRVEVLGTTIVDWCSGGVGLSTMVRCKVVL